MVDTSSLQLNAVMSKLNIVSTTEKLVGELNRVFEESELTTSSQLRQEKISLIPFFSPEALACPTIRWPKHGIKCEKTNPLQCQWASDFRVFLQICVSTGEVEFEKGQKEGKQKDAIWLHYGDCGIQCFVLFLFFKILPLKTGPKAKTISLSCKILFTL